MRLEFYPESNTIFEKMLLNFDFYFDCFDGDSYVNLKFENNSIVYQTTSGSKYILSKDSVIFDGFRGSLVYGCGLFQIWKDITGCYLRDQFTNEIEKIFLVKYQSSQPDWDWFSTKYDNDIKELYPNFQLHTNNNSGRYHNAKIQKNLGS